MTTPTYPKITTRVIPSLKILEWDFSEGESNECGEGTITTQTLDGSTLVFKVDGPNFRTFKKALEPSVGSALAEKRLARQLFYTDSRVQAFVDQKAETARGLQRAGHKPMDPYDDQVLYADRYLRAMAIAWKLDEHGWRTEAEKRAKEVCSVPLGEFGVHQGSDDVGPTV